MIAMVSQSGETAYYKKMNKFEIQKMQSEEDEKSSLLVNDDILFPGNFTYTASTNLNCLNG